MLLFPSFVIYLITMVGETNRLPFDLPEGEGELVGGFHTEYSSLKFALFYLAEYVNMTTVAALATTLFLGGWRAPWPISVWSGANSGWWALLWFLAKVLILLFCFVWLRGTLPRIRYDQLMAFGWKVLIPASLAWILMIATIRVWRQHGGSAPVYIVGGGHPGRLAAAGLGGRRGRGEAARRRRASRGRCRGGVGPASGTATSAPATVGAEAGAGGVPRPSPGSAALPRCRGVRQPGRHTVRPRRRSARHRQGGHRCLIS